MPYSMVVYVPNCRSLSVKNHRLGTQPTINGIQYNRHKSTRIIFKQRRHHHHLIYNLNQFGNHRHQHSHRRTINNVCNYHRCDHDQRLFLLHHQSHHLFHSILICVSDSLLLLFERISKYGFHKYCYL